MSEYDTTSCTNAPKPRDTIPLPALTLEQTDPSGNKHHDNGSTESDLVDTDFHLQPLPDEDEQLDPTVKMPILQSKLHGKVQSTRELTENTFDHEAGTVIEEDEQTAPTQKMVTLSRLTRISADPQEIHGNSSSAIASPANTSDDTPYSIVLQLSERDVDGIIMSEILDLLAAPNAFKAPSQLHDDSSTAQHIDIFEDLSELDIDSIAVMLSIPEGRIDEPSVPSTPAQDGSPAAAAEVPVSDKELIAVVDTPEREDTANTVESEEVGDAEGADRHEQEQTVPSPDTYEEEEPAPPSRSLKHRLLRHLLRTHWRSLATFLVLLVLLISASLLWQNITSTHLLLGALNPANGTIRALQDLGAYPHNVILTAPFHSSSTALLGIHTDTPGGTQRVLSLRVEAATWHVQTSFSASLTAGSLSLAPNGQLLVESADGMQIMTSDGQLLWQVQALQPARGAHAFQPASDGHAVYGVQSVTTSQVAAYDLHSGRIRWTRKLHDTLNYAPPFLLNTHTLYIAADQSLYALNSTDGSILWTAPYTARTLLIVSNEQRRLLVAAGAQGLVAFDPATGEQVWHFTGQISNTLTSPQLYQATVASIGSPGTPIIYATGIVWQVPEMREQVWLYAVNANSGQALWSRQMAAGFVSADAGRTFIPLVDTANRLVFLQQQINTDELRISALDMTHGTPRWQVVLNSVRSAPALLQTPDGSILYFTTVASSSLLLPTFSPSRIIMALLIVLSLVGIYVLWFLPREQGRLRLWYLQKFVGSSWHTTRNRALLLRQHIRRRHLTRSTVIAILLPLVACSAALAYTQFNSPQASIAQVNMITGSSQWQRALGTSAQPIGTDTYSSVIVTDTSENLHQLEVLNNDGTVLWKSFASEGSFSFPVIPDHPGTLLIALSNQSVLPYHYASDDPFYASVFGHMLAFYLFDRTTGHILWQHIALYPGEHQRATVVGADSTYIYVVGTPTGSIASPLTISTGATAQLQLFAVNQATGMIDWHIFGPSIEINASDSGTLLFGKRQVIWQVAGTIYAIDPLMGQIEWRHPFLTANSRLELQEQLHMAMTANTLLVLHNDSIHALDLSSGNELWTLPLTGIGSKQDTVHMTAIQQAMFVAKGTDVSAYTLTGHQIWEQAQPGTVQDFTVADNGSLIYLFLQKNTSSEVTALESQTGNTRWTYTLPASASLLQHNGLLDSHGAIFIGACLGTKGNDCSSAQLVILNAETGEPTWNTEVQSITAISLSQDGSRVLYQALGRPWSGIHL
jgi:outer membrane protein assembly factor BamB